MEGTYSKGMQKQEEESSCDYEVSCESVVKLYKKRRLHKRLCCVESLIKSFQVTYMGGHR